MEGKQINYDIPALHASVYAALLKDETKIFLLAWKLDKEEAEIYSMLKVKHKIFSQLEMRKYIKEILGIDESIDLFFCDVNDYLGA